MAGQERGAKDRPFIIPVFIPHQGCSHRCVFCDQNNITGHTTGPATTGEIRSIIRSWLQRHSHSGGNGGRQVQIAFYGGSFTALPVHRQEALLAEANRWLQQGRVQAIRLSTRPDCINDDILSLLRRYRVSIVELGVQSMNDKVLAAANRGHSSDDSRRAVGLLKQAGITVGVQLMLGLPKDTPASLRQTVEETIRLQPDLARIYPVLVLRGSRLEKMFLNGEYRPLSLARAVILAARVHQALERASIRIIRVGLQAERSLEAALVAGPYHPAFGELVRSRILSSRIRSALALIAAAGSGTLVLSTRDRSLVYGHGARLFTRLQRAGLGEQFLLRFVPDVGQGRVRLDLSQAA